MNIPGLSVMSRRIAAMGGVPQQDRMIKDKKLTFDRALKYSYQAANVRKIGEDKEVRALINPNQLKQDYDDKIISIDFEYGYSVGDVFEWVNTGTKWLIYLQELTELAYFRGDVRKCSYEVEWLDNGEKKKTYLALRGPVETKIKTGVKHGMSIDTPNASLNIILPKNEDTLKYFKRYAKFYLPIADEPYNKVCWRVEAIDAFSTPGILEMVAVEYYSNDDTDDIENGIVDAFVAKPIDPNPEGGMIEGETFIKPQFEYTYKYTGSMDGNWYVDEKLPVLLDDKGSKTVNIKWDSSFSGQFDLHYGDYTKTIIVESLF